MPDQLVPAAPAPGAGAQPTGMSTPTPPAGSADGPLPALPTITAPKGGGAIKGIGEKFAANPVTGTGAMTIPVAVPPGRSGFGPALTLAYDSGSGNGPFGFGWTLSTPSITRKTDKGLPHYVDADESDVFILSGSEDLVPVLNPDSSRHTDTTTAPGWTVHRYRPRIEGLFARIERWVDNQTGQTHWRSISRDNITTRYGATPESRIADIDRTFSWLICESYDDKGNAIRYEYVAEDARNVDLARPNEQARDRSRNRYLKRILYGNRMSRLIQPDLHAPDWMFEAVFDYDEGHCRPIPPDPGKAPQDQHELVHATSTPIDAWPVRPDPYSTHRPGFEVRSYRRCRRILTFHRFPELGGQPCLVRSTDLDYADLDLRSGPVRVEAELAHQGSTRFASFLMSVTQAGYVRDPEAAPRQVHDATAQTYLRKTMPPVEFTYSKAVIQDQIYELDPDSLRNLPVGLDGREYQWVDLDGEGIAGVLTEQSGAWYYKPNLGNGRLGALQAVPTQPSTVSLAGHGQLLDLAGDGRLDAVTFAGPVAGFAKRTDEGTWAPFRAFPAMPNLPWDDPDLRFIDLDGDGHADVLITENDVFTWYPALGEDGFGPARRVTQPSDSGRGPRLVFADGEQALYTADMVGDGLADLVRIRNGQVCYWPNLGQGRFGSQIILDNSPWLDRPDGFDQRRVRLADIDGSGTTDLIYLGGDGVQIYFNQSGNRLSDPRTLAAFPAVNQLSTVQVADLLGTGTACLIWSSQAAADAQHPIKYVDLMGGNKPHLLTSSRNNLGAETHIQYTSSTRFYLADRSAGKPWISRLPFPVHVVDRVEALDKISGNRFITRYAYHHGHFDGFEREFRGFGMVEQWDTETFAALTEAGLTDASNIDEASHVPPVLTKTWFHTGVFQSRDHVSDYFACTVGAQDTGEYYREPDLTDAQARALLLEDTLLPGGLTAEEQREACRALKGAMLRQEIYGLDDSDRQDHPYIVTEQNFTIRAEQRQGINRHGIFFTHPHESISYHYERHPTDPRVTHALTLEVDTYGNTLRAATVGYGRRIPDPTLTPADQAVQARTVITLDQSAVTNAVAAVADYRLPLPCEARRYELTGLVLPDGSARLTFDAVDQAFATAEELPYEVSPTDGVVQKRLIAHNRVLYRSDDLTGPLPIGVLEPCGLPYESYRLAYTPGLITAVFGNRVTASMLADDGRYTKATGESGWWMPSGRTYLSPATGDIPAEELVFAQQHFFLPHRHRDPFHTTAMPTETVVTYDRHDLLAVQTIDALDNRVIASRLDYRVLQPAEITDPNRNRVTVAYDALGMVVASAVMGKADDIPTQGDRLTPDLRADLTQGEVARFMADPRGPVGAELLGDASTRLIHDLHAYRRSSKLANPTPTYVAAIARETHVSQPVPATGLRFQVTFSYSDGYVREIQKKIPVEPGPVSERDPTGVIVIDGSGKPRTTTTDVATRWAANGWTIFNNKGKPVRQYEPFFTDTHSFEFDTRIGVSPILCYDPVERVVATVHPNHTWEKVVFDPWGQETWDVNDTVLIADPATDGDVGAFLGRLPSTDIAPTWYALRTDPTNATEALSRWPDAQTRAAEQRAAQQTAVHAATPTIAHTDSLGRPVITLAKNRFAYSNGPPGLPPAEETCATHVVLDIQGNQRSVVDGLGRNVMRYAYDILGNRVHQAGMDAGRRWTLNDVASKPIYTWDSKDRRIRNTYDALRRPTGAILQDGSTAEVNVGRTIYGETRADPEVANLRMKIVEVRDQAGVVSTDEYDFKGNTIRSGRQLASAYDRILDWFGTVALEVETYTEITRYDALNRPTQIVAPHSDQPGTMVNLVQYAYGQANLLDQVHAWLSLASEPDGPLDVATATQHAVSGTEYDAKGRRTLISYGNGTGTRYVYDPLTSRLTRLTTGRLQDLTYTYDPVGNVTELRDSAQQTLFFRNNRVEAGAHYIYDAVYRLIEATGREHLGQIGGRPISHSYDDASRIGLPHPGDGNALGRYVERYVYDAAGNFSTMQHIGSDPSAPGWTRTYSYVEQSQLEPADRSNRLSSSVVGQTLDAYGYDVHGSMLKMPQLQEIRWNFQDQLQMTRRQAVNARDADGQAQAGERTWYVYDAAGLRIRKVTESAPGQVKDDRIYLGGFETYRRNGASVIHETLHLLDDQQRIALVENINEGAAQGVPKHLVRYQLGNHLGSVNLELDGSGELVSYEEYTAFGSTSYQAFAGSFPKSKRYRNMSKERDAESGFCYHGHRYYVPWLGRWSSFDPSGIGAGLNGYEFVRCNPVNLVDPNGRSWKSFLGGVAVGLGTAVLVVAIVATAPISIPASVAVGATVVGVGATGYTLVQSARQRDVFNRRISPDQADFQAGTGIGGLLAGAASGPISGGLSSIGPSALTSAGVTVPAAAAVSPAIVNVVSAGTTVAAPILTTMIGSHEGGSGEGSKPPETKSTDASSSAGSPKSPVSAAKPGRLLKQAEEAGLRDEIEGPVEIFVHGTTKAPAAAIIESQGANLSPSGGKFGGKLFTVPNADVAKVFASRSASQVAGGEESLVGIALPRSVAAQLKAEKLLVPGTISSPPPGVPASTQEWVFQPGSLQTLSKEGFFFKVQF
jgi:RHS repeat-associated protein